jgi:hypothetical protein
MPPPLPYEHRRPRHVLWVWLAIPFVIFGFYIAICSLDEKPHNVSDLTFEPLALADTENAYEQLAFAAAQAAETLSLTEQDKDKRDSFIAGETWDQSQVSAWLVALSSTWPRYEQAARLPQSQGPIPQSPEDVFPEIGQIQRLCQFQLLRAREALHRNDSQAALTYALTNLHAGSRIADSRSSLICYLTGIAIRTSALAVILEAARHPDCPPALIRETARQLDSLRSTVESLAYSFRGELYFANGALAIVEKNGLGSLADVDSSSLIFRLVPRIQILYKGNKTRRIYADSLREAISHINADATELILYREQINSRRKDNLSRNPDNAIGRIFLAIVTPTWPALVHSHVNDESRVSAYQALLAILAYQRDYGAPPRTLDQLVPAYLASIPQDHFTRAPIRYDPDLKVIWSAGENNLIVNTPGQEPQNREIILWLDRPTAVSAP